MTTPVRPPSDAGAAPDQSSAARTLHALGTLSTVHNALQTARDERDLLTSTCTALVDTAGYLSAWYVQPADEGSAPKVTAHAGRDPEDELLARLPMPWTPAWREEWNDDPPVVQDTRSDSCCCLVAPVRTDDGAAYALVICSDDPDRFDVPTRDLARLVTDHLGIELSLRTHAGAEATSAELMAAHNTRLRATLDAMLDPFVLFLAVRDEEGTLVDLRYTEANEAAVEYNHLTREQMIGTRLLDLFPGQLENGPLRLYFQTIETGEPTVLDDYAYPHEILGQERRYDIRATKAGDGLALTWRDVTDRHRAATRLSDSERLYRLLAENSSEAIMLSDDAKTISWASESSTSVLGYPPDEIVGHAPTDFLHPDDIPSLVEAIAASEASGDVARVESRWRLPDGSYCWVESGGRPLGQEESGGSAGRVISVHRIDQRIHAKEELAEREQLYRLVTENASDAILLVDGDGRCSWVSESVQHVLGWEPSDMLGRSPADFIHPDDLPTVITGRARTDASGETLRLRVRLRLPDETYCWVETAGRRIADDGDARRVVAFHRVDEQVRAEKELADRDRLYRLLAENSSDVIFLADPEGRLNWVSASARDTLGWEPHELLGHLSTDFVHSDDTQRLAAAIAESSRSGGDALVRYRWRLPDGSYRWVEGLGHPVSDEAGTLNRVVRLRDIEDQVAAEQELFKREEMFRLIAENSRDVVILSDLDTTALWVSPSVTSTLGWDPEDLIGHPGQDYVHPDDWPTLQPGDTVEDWLGRPARYRHRRRDGSWMWVEALPNLVSSPSDAEPRLVIRLRDIDEQVRAEELRDENEQLYRLMAENSNDVVIVADENGRASWVSPSAATVLGWAPEEILGHSAFEFLHPDDVEPTKTKLAESVRDGTLAHTVYRWRRSDGTYTWVEARGENLPTGHDQPLRRVVRLRDVEERIHAQQELVASERRYRLLASNASDIVWQVDDNGILQWISPSATTLLGWSTDELVGRPSSDLIEDEDRRGFTQLVDQANDRRTATGEFRVLRQDGTSVWMQITLRVAREDEVAARIGTLRNIDDEVSARASLDFALRHDQFTGLPTRESILDLASLASGPDRRVARLAMLVIGIDLLKDINDAYGHATGDIVVTTVAARLAKALDRPELLGRGTGDEFIAALVDIQSPAEAATAAERLRTAVHGDIELASGHVSATVSIGIATASDDADVDSLLRQATVAMHHAKEHGRDRWTFADPAQADEAAQRMAMESAMHRSLDRHEFEPWFQPIVALDDGRLTGYEALARWRRDDHVQLPDEFLPTAGRTPFMTGIDMAMVEPVVTALAGLPDDIFVAVNVSAPTLAHANYADLVLDALARHDVPGRRLHIEITETLLLDVDESVVTQMQRLADEGVRWYVDDFGTGYSSIAHLRDLPVSGLKLDKSFTSGIGDGNHTARQLADALIGLANGLGLDSVAEGVETEAEAAYLRTLGWRHAQGWLYGKAAPLK